MDYTKKEILLKLENVCLSFDNNHILNNINLELKNIVRPGLTQGQVVGFLGPSGRGKTQLFRIIAGLQNPTSGNVLINQNNKLVPVASGMIGVVDQHYTLFDHRTIGQNLMIAGNLSGKTKKDSLDKSRELLKKFKLEDKWNQFPGNLSGGQRQRVAIAQQIMCSRGFLLMDEPFSGLDPNMKEKACELITEISSMDELLTIIVVTHDVSSAIKIADTIWLLGYCNNQKEGSTIQEEIDLIDIGIAWKNENESSFQAIQLYNKIIQKFKSL